MRGAGRRGSARRGLAECGEEESWRTPRFLPNHLNASIPGSKNTERGTCGQDCASSLSQEKSEISGGIQQVLRDRETWSSPRRRNEGSMCPGEKTMCPQQALRGDLRARRVWDAGKVPWGSEEMARETRSSPRGRREGTMCPGGVVVSRDQRQTLCHSCPTKQTFHPKKQQGDG